MIDEMNVIHSFLSHDRLSLCLLFAALEFYREPGRPLYHEGLEGLIIIVHLAWVEATLSTIVLPKYKPTSSGRVVTQT